MAHPFHHARSSVRQHGGEIGDYLTLHEWFDSSKAAWADMRHRAILHSSWGVAQFLRIFGETLTRSSDRVVLPSEILAIQHMEEDLGRQATPADWLSQIDATDGPGRSLAIQCHVSATRLGGEPSDYRPIHEWMHSPMTAWDDPRALRITHNSFGIFLAEEVLGSTITRLSDGLSVPTRIIAEYHVLTDHQTIPTLQDKLTAIRPTKWMMRGAAPLSRILGIADLEEIACQSRCAGCPGAAA